MKQFLAKSPFLVLVLVGTLAAGTALVAGYVDGPNQGGEATAVGKCADCPKAGTEACCQATGVCQDTGMNASADGQSTCAAKPAGGCCQEKAQAVSCCGECPATATESSCGAGGCVHTE